MKKLLRTFRAGLTQMIRRAFPHLNSSSGRLRVIRLEDRRLPDASIAAVGASLVLDGFDPAAVLTMGNPSPDRLELHVDVGTWDPAVTALGFSLSPDLQTAAADVTAIAAATGTSLQHIRVADAVSAPSVVQSSPSGLAIPQLSVTSSDTVNFTSGMDDFDLFSASSGTVSVVDTDDLQVMDITADASGEVTLRAEDGLHLSGLLSADGGKAVLRSGASGDLRITGEVDVGSAAGVGGEVELIGERISIDSGGRVTASGASGGGTVRIGDFGAASFVFLDQAAEVNASAEVHGPGGDVFIRSDEATLVHGRLEADGAGVVQSGGLIETSSQGHNDLFGIQVSAAGGDADASPGEWVIAGGDIEVRQIDPAASVSAGSIYPSAFTTLSGPTRLDADDLTAALNNSTDITLQAEPRLTANTEGDVLIAADVTRSDGTTPVTLQIDASGSVHAESIWSSLAGPLNMELTAGDTVTLNGAVTTNGGDFRIASSSFLNAASLDAGPGDVRIDSTEFISVGGDVTAGSIELNSGTADLSADLSAADSVSVNAATAVAGFRTVSGRRVVFAKSLAGGTTHSPVDGGGSLLVRSEQTILEGAAGLPGARLDRLITDSDGVTHLNAVQSPSVSVVSLAQFSDTVVLGADQAILSTGEVHLESGIEGPHALHLTAGENLFIGGPVGQSSPLSELSADTAATIILQSRLIHTSGPQQYAADVSIEPPIPAEVWFISETSEVRFVGDVIPAADDHVALLVSTNQLTAVGQIGSTDNRLESLTLSEVDYTGMVRSTDDVALHGPVFIAGDFRQLGGNGTTRLAGGIVGGTADLTTAEVRFTSGTLQVGDELLVSASDRIEGGARDGIPDAEAERVGLTAGGAGIGTEVTPEITARSQFNAAATDADIRTDFIGDGRLGTVSAGTGTVQLSSTSVLVDALEGEGAGSVNLSGGRAVLTAVAGAGAEDDLDTSVDKIRVFNQSSGSVRISEVGSLGIEVISNGDRLVSLDAGVSVVDCLPGESEVNVTAGQLAVRSAYGVGETDDIDLSVDRVAVRTSHGGDIRLENSRTLVVGSVDGISATDSLGGDIEIRSAEGIRLEHSIDAGAGSVRLRAGGTLVQAEEATLKADRLAVEQVSDTGDVRLTAENTVRRLAIRNAGTTTTVYRNAGDILVDRIDPEVFSAPNHDSIVGVSVAGDLLIDSGGDIRIGASVSTADGAADILLKADGGVTQDAILNGRKLAIRHGADVLLPEANNIRELASQSAVRESSLTVHAAPELRIGSIPSRTEGRIGFASVTGISTEAGDINVTSGNGIIVGEDIIAAAADGVHDGEEVTLLTHHGDIVIEKGVRVSTDETPVPGVSVDRTEDRVTIAAGVVSGTGNVLISDGAEIRTDGGVARQIAPRPQAFVAEPTAFVTLGTSAEMRSPLVASPDGLIGELELVFGVLGEENLEVVIDWGSVAQTSLTDGGVASETTGRPGEPGVFEFSRADARKSVFSIEAGGVVYVIPHRYELTDLINSPFDRNGRQHNPNIMGVRISVAQHNSISIWGSGAVNPADPNEVFQPPEFSLNAPAQPVSAATIADTSGYQPYGEHLTVSDAAGGRISLPTAGLALLSSTDTNPLHQFGQQSSQLPFENIELTASGKPEGLAEWEFVAGPTPGLVLVPPETAPELVVPELFVQESPAVSAEIVQDVSFGSGAASESAVGTDVYLQVRRRFEVDGEAAVVVRKVADAAILSDREQFEKFIAERPQLSDGAGYELWLVTDTGGRFVERPVMTFEITAGRPGPATQPERISDEPPVLKDVPFEADPVPQEDSEITTESDS